MHAINNGTYLNALHPSNNPTTTYLPLHSNLSRVGGIQNNGSPPLACSQAAALAAVASAAGLPTTMKDSRWLTLEVCRQYQRKICSRDENECKFAHAPPQVDVQNGRVICCYDSIKGKCQRKDPPCKYFHPPQHLREQLLQNGRNNLIMKSMQLQMLQQQFIAQGAILPLSPSSASPNSAGNGSPQLPPQPGSPVSSASITSSGKLIYPTAPQLNLTAPGMAAAYSLLLSQQMTHPPVSPMLESANPFDAYLLPMMTAQTAGGRVASPPFSMDLMQTGQKRTAACIGNVPQGSYMFPGMMPDQQLMSYLDPSQFGSFPNVTASQQNQQLSMNLSPYFNAVAASQLNPMVAAVAALNAVKGCPVSNGTHLSHIGPLCMMAMQTAAPHPLNSLPLPSTTVANGTITPAKRPALADANSGLPMFDSPTSVVTSKTTTVNNHNNNNLGLYTFQPVTLAAGQNSVIGTDESWKGAKEGDDGAQQPQLSLQPQVYSETNIEIPQYGYL